MNSISSFNNVFNFKRKTQETNLNSQEKINQSNKVHKEHQHASTSHQHQGLMHWMNAVMAEHMSQSSSPGANNSSVATSATSTASHYPWHEQHEVSNIFFFNFFKTDLTQCMMRLHFTTRICLVNLLFHLNMIISCLSLENLFKYKLRKKKCVYKQLLLRVVLLQMKYP